MKSSILKIALGMLILSGFAFKAQSPNLPTVTTINVSGLNNYYAAQICCHGYEVGTCTEYSDWVIVYNPGADALFNTYHKFIHVSEAPSVWVTVGVYVKQYSNSPWTFMCSTASWTVGFDATLDGDWLVNGSFEASYPE
jgi:hypothetical protein